MKYLIVLLLFLTGCTQNPGQFEGKILRGFYSNRNHDDNRLEVYSKEFGFMDVYNSPFFEKARIGSKVVVACKYMKSIFGGPYDCQILGVINEQGITRQDSGRN